MCAIKYHLISGANLRLIYCAKHSSVVLPLEMVGRWVKDLKGWSEPKGTDRVHFSLELNKLKVHRYNVIKFHTVGKTPGQNDPFD